MTKFKRLQKITIKAGTVGLNPILLSKLILAHSSDLKEAQKRFYVNTPAIFGKSVVFHNVEMYEVFVDSGRLEMFYIYSESDLLASFMMQGV